MCDFNNLDDTAKSTYHTMIMQCANAFGGKNFFLQLLEAVRQTKPHPIIGKHMWFSCDHGTIEWNKVIFKDKLDLFLKVRVLEGKQANFLPSPEDKSFKNVMNLVRTLGPIKFEVKPANSEDGKGFTVNAFDKIDENTTRINPIFDALFFCSVETIKKVMNYTPKGS